ncbi:hypothetical protein AgCh_001370 [Apium graveolens]
MDQGESSNQRSKVPRQSPQVIWSGPNLKKGEEDNGNGVKRIRAIEGNGEWQNGTDENSNVEGSYNLEEYVEKCSKQKIIYERKRRSCSDGGYNTKLPADAKPTLYLLKNGKGFKESKPKYLLSYIVKIRFDDKTINTKGAQREAFLDSCIEEFKEYYEYPKGCGPERGDRVVRAQLKKNWKHIINPEKARLMAHVNELLESGHPEEDIDIREMKPHYFSQRAWNSLCAYWGIPQFITRAGVCLGWFYSVSLKGMGEIDVEREAKGEEPIGEDECLGVVYDPSEPVVKNLQDKIKMLLAAQAESTPELSPDDQPPSPQTRKEIQRKKGLEVLIRVKPPKKGSIFLHPRKMLPELIGAAEATQLINREASKNAQARANIPDEICLRMVMILDEVKHMVQSLPMREESPVDKAALVDGTKAVIVDGMDNFEDEDPHAHFYLLD